MLTKARQSTDVKARTKLYEQMQVLEKEEAPDFTIAHSVVFEVMRKNVVGYKTSPLGAHEFYGVDLK
jgi:dipeptide transport system substrate-binding protein